MRPDPDVVRERGAAAVRALRRAAFCAFLVAALSACRSVVVVPDDPSWTITGREETAVATWRTGTVEVSVPLELRGDATVLWGTIRNAGSAAVVSFEPSAEVDRRGLSGTLYGTRPDSAGRWTSLLVPWTDVEVPAGTRESPAILEFELSPDRPWTDTTAPDLGSTITWVVHVADESGESSCPLFFHVNEAAPGFLHDPRTKAVASLAALAGLFVWAAYL
jgi:hypothetical protein